MSSAWRHGAAAAALASALVTGACGAPPVEPTFALGADRHHALTTVRFEARGARLEPDGFAELVALADALRRQQHRLARVRVRVTPDPAAPAARAELAGQRARAVAEFLIRRGVPRRQLAWEGRADYAAWPPGVEIVDAGPNLNPSPGARVAGAPGTQP